jgi:hypothetical protein
VRIPLEQSRVSYSTDYSPLGNNLYIGGHSIDNNRNFDENWLVVIGVTGNRQPLDTMNFSMYFRVHRPNSRTIITLSPDYLLSSYRFVTEFQSNVFW